MKQIAAFLKDYIRTVNYRSFALVALLTCAAVFLNYHFHIEKSLVALPDRVTKFLCFFALYLFIFAGSYLFVEKTGTDRFYVILLIAVPIIFAARMSSGNLLLTVTNPDPGPWWKYFSLITNAPIKFLLLIILIKLIQRWGGYAGSPDGLKKGSIPPRPFLVCVAIFTPVILVAAAQPAFVHAYPRFKNIRFIFNETSQPWLTIAGFEAGYFFDFMFTEVFFRGLLIFAFVRYVGQAAILPMAALYCAIHFGKPLPECVSSFFGGILLGIISYRTGSVIGGIIIHFGIGMVMEIAGWYFGGV